MRIIFIYILIVIFISLSMSIWAQESKFQITQTACVDIRKILNTVSQNYNLQKYLLSKEESFKEASLSIKNKIQELEIYLKENQDTLTQQNIEEIQTEIEYQKLDLDGMLLSKIDDDSTDEIIYRGIYRLIKEIAEKDGLSIVVEKSAGGVIYNRPEIDITDKILEHISRQSGEKESE